LKFAEKVLLNSDRKVLINNAFNIFSAGQCCMGVYTETAKIGSSYLSASQQETTVGLLVLAGDSKKKWR
jgi:hypothetical protein